MSHQLPNLRASLSGWNGSRSSDHSSPEVFLASYLRRFPDRQAWLRSRWAEALTIATQLVSPRPTNYKAAAPVERHRVSEAPRHKQEWVPRSRYIPDNPNPRGNYLRQAVNIARSMREKLEAEEKAIAMDLRLKEYRVTLLADDELQSIKVWAAGKRQAGITASKTARKLIDARTIQIKRVAEVHYKPWV